MKINYHRLLASPSRALAVLTITTFSTSLTAGDRPTTPISIQVTDHSGGKITRSEVTARSHRLLVTGSFKPSPGQDIPANAHLDVELRAADGTPIAAGRDDIDPAHPRLSRGRNGRKPFVVGFPADLLDRTSVVSITYHSAPHP